MAKQECAVVPIARRHFLQRGPVWLAGPTVLATSAGCTTQQDYAVAAGALRAPLRVLTDAATQMRELVRCATLAPNGHNTQPWRFQISGSEIRISPDHARRTPVVDPDDHHIWVSLGCATENLVLAAAAAGWPAQVQFDGRDIVVTCARGTATRLRLVDAMFRRQCTRAPYDGQPATTAALDALQASVRDTGVELRLLTGKPQLESVLEYVAQGNSAQMRDPVFVAELRDWIRFNESQAIASGDGLFAGASGNPALPNWLGRRLFNAFFTEKNENDKYAKQLRSSAGVVVLTGARADPASWIDVGRCCQRLLLTATVLDLRTAFINQPVEVSTLRPQFARWLGLGAQRPDLVLRFGHGPQLPYSFRRPVAQVLV